MKKRLSSFDPHYQSGHLSVFPQAKDSRFTLYEVTNNATTVLKHSISPTSKYLTVESTEKFPEAGILRLYTGKGEDEFIYYGKKVSNQFHHLQRGFAGHKSFAWGANTPVSLPVMSEHHNVLKDAILNIQKKIGLSQNAQEDSVLKMVQNLEEKWVSPKANFRAYPKTGIAPHAVNFKNFSPQKGTRFLWDFGDDTTSIEPNPTHVYEKEGKFTVRLSIIASNAAQGFTEKSEYIEVNNNTQPFFYIDPPEGDQNTEFEFIDQTPDIKERHWFLGDETDFAITDPRQHTLKYRFHGQGTHKIVLMLRTQSNQLLKTSGVVNVA